MLKSWLISLFVLILLFLVYYLKIFEWLASGSAFWTGAGLVICMLVVAFFVLGNPLRKEE